MRNRTRFGLGIAFVAALGVAGVGVCDAGQTAKKGARTTARGTTVKGAAGASGNGAVGAAGTATTADGKTVSGAAGAKSGSCASTCDR